MRSQATHHIVGLLAPGLAKRGAVRHTTDVVQQELGLSLERDVFQYDHVVLHRLVYAWIALQDVVSWIVWPTR